MYYRKIIKKSKFQDDRHELCISKKVFSVVYFADLVYIITFPFWFFHFSDLLNSASSFGQLL